MIDQDSIQEDFRELIAATDDVKTISQCKEFIKSVSHLSDSWADEIEDEIKSEICLDELYLNVNSDETVRNTFNELTITWTEAVNGFLKTWRDY